MWGKKDALFSVGLNPGYSYCSGVCIPLKEVEEAPVKGFLYAVVMFQAKNPLTGAVWRTDPSIYNYSLMFLIQHPSYEIL